MKLKTNNILGLIVFAGALMLVLGVFCTWGTAYGTDLSGTGAYGYWDMDHDMVDFGYAPLICAICGVIALVLMIVPAILDFGEDSAKVLSILGIISLVLAILSFIFVLLFINSDTMDDTKTGSGAYMCITGSVIIIIGGILPILQAKGIIKL